MNNKILFRGFHPDENGKTVITVYGEKVKGDWIIWDIFGRTNTEIIVKTSNGYYTTYRVDFEHIIHETVGQFVTTDKNGKDLFEGDIVKNNRGELMLIEWVQKYTRFTLTCKEKGIIISTFVPEQCELISNKWECAE